MYTRILTALDGSDLSEQVIPLVQSLAAGLSIPTTLLHVIEPETLTIPQMLNPSLHTEEFLSHRMRHASQYVEPVADEFRQLGLTVRAEIPQGEPATAIVDEAAKDPGTLIAMSSHGRSGLARWWMGSVTDKVLHLTDNPLLVIRSEAQSQERPRNAFRNITVPVDGSELAEEILPHVVYLSSTMRLAVDLVRVNPSRDEYYRSLSIGPSGVTRVTPSYEGYIDLVDGEAEGYLADLKEKLIQQGAASVTTNLLHGSPATAIADFSTSTPNNLVAMTTHGRSGVGRLVLGSVAERVVRQSGDPVLLIRAAREEHVPLSGAPATA